MIKKILVILLFILIPAISFAGPNAAKLGELTIKKRMIQGNDVIQALRIDDPDNPFITIYFTRIESGAWTAANPSNTSIACRLTGKIPVDEDGKQVINTTPRANIASISQSIGFKKMKIGRFYDKQKNVMVYIVYSTKILDGSLKHSTSVVPLGIPLAP
jgi:CreA protein